MVSTFLAYDLVVRDLKSSLERTASDGQVARESAYYEENIGKVTTMEEFLDDYRLYAYAMKAYGLEEMTYAKAFMKKVLESDLTDESSFANSLSDERYRNFAQAYQFTGQTTDAQTTTQETELFDLYKAAQVTQANDVQAETYYYESMIGSITSAAQLVKNGRLMDYLAEAYGIDREKYTKEHFVKVLTSDLNDSDSYLNQLMSKDAASDNDYNSAAFYKLNQAFGFNTDGTLSGTTPQTDTQKEATVKLYVDGAQTYVSEYSLSREKAYYQSKIATITSVSQLTSDSRLFAYVQTAFQLDTTVTPSVFKSIVTSDLTAADNYALTNGGEDWVAIAQAFNFGTDGNVKSGYAAQQGTQLASTNTAYAEHYDDEDQAAMQQTLDYYASKLDEITNVDDLLDNESLLVVLRRSFGIEEGEFTKNEMRKVLLSDVTDPKSYANKSRDERLVKMAQMFNFDSEGDAAVPLQAQNQFDITLVAKNYIVSKIRFLKGDEQTTAKEAATTESEYYQKQIGGIRTVDELLADRRVVDVVLVAYGFNPDDVTDDFLKQAFASDLTDDKSFVNEQDDPKWAELVASFNFDSDGNLTRDTVGTVQQRGSALATINDYVRQTLEENEGESNEAVRLALYFERMAPTITDAYELIADDALAEVFRVTFGLSDEFSSMNVDMQAKVINKNIDFADMQDPAEVKKFVQRFMAMYDAENGDYSSGALSVLTGSGSTGISGDLLLSIATLKS